MANSKDIVPQAAAIPVRDGQVCLITSGAGRWIVPKGMVDAGMTAEEAALQEAWEEAGLRGTIRPDPVGSYCYEKWGMRLEVTMYVMEVTESCETWPEVGSRRRRWLPADDALQLVDTPALRDLLAKALSHLC